MPTCNFCSKSFTSEASLRNHQSRWCSLYLNHKKKKQQLIRSILLRNKNSGKSELTSYSEIDTPISTPMPHNVITENENDTAAASGSGGIRRSTRVPITKVKPETNTTATTTATNENQISDFESRENFQSAAGIDTPNFQNSASVSVSKTGLVEQPFSPYDCRYCIENFPSMEDRSIHERQSHVPAVKPYKCKSCFRRFFFAADCNYHEELHSRNCLDLTISVKCKKESPSGTTSDFNNTATEQQLKELPNKTAADIDIDIGNNGNESGTSSTDSSSYFNCKLCTSSFINKRRLKLHMNWRHAGGHENGSQSYSPPAENKNENLHIHNNTVVPSQNREQIISKQPIMSASTTSSKPKRPAQNSDGIKSNKKSAKAKVPKINDTGVNVNGRNLKAAPKIQLNPNHAVEAMQPNGKLEYICVLCGKQLRHSYNALTEHSNLHTGFQPFKCEICDKNFRKTEGLLTHKTVHSGIKLLKCHICQKPYRWPSGLYAHVKKHKL